MFSYYKPTFNPLIKHLKIYYSYIYLVNMVWHRQKLTPGVSIYAGFQG